MLTWNPSTWQEDREFKASLVYIASSKLGWVTGNLILCQTNQERPVVAGSAAAQQNGPTAILSRGLESRELRYPALLCRVPTVDPDILPANGFQSLMKARKEGWIR